MVGISKRLRASVRMDAINGDSFERSVCAKQMTEAADLIESLERERDALLQALRDIENPLAFLQREADTNCDKLDGMMAVILSKDAAFLKSIAAKALQEVQPNER